MILIFSREGDAATSRLARRLSLKGNKYRIINESDVYYHQGEIISINEDEQCVFGIPTSEIQSAFFRKWNKDLIWSSLNTSEENKLALSEYGYVFDFIGAYSFKKKLGFYNVFMHNKLLQQWKAKESGLYVLNNIICNDKLPKIKGQWVSKPLNGTLNTAHEYGNHATVFLNDLSIESFGLGYIQPFINKSFEIRAMYLNGDFFAIAYKINSCAEPDRRYTEKTLSVVPFDLPVKEKKQLHLLMQNLGGNYALIDILYEEESQRFYFLEANPFGQYDDLIEYGGYDVDGAIADYLSN
jgi:hypothetical protein